MDRSLSFRCLAVTAAATVLLPFGALAQSSPKPPPRLPPNAAESSRIPSGVDTGSPATSDSLPLGTPIPPAAAADGMDQKTRSAAARAAARPKPPASSVDCVNRLIPDTAAGTGKPAPVALPKSGFTGSSATPTTAAQTTAAKTPTRLGC